MLRQTNDGMAAAQTPHAAQVKAQLLRTLQDLGDKDFKGFKWHLKNFEIIPASELDPADRSDTVDLLVQYFPLDPVDSTINLLKSINRNDLVLRLSQNNAGGHQR